MHESFQSMSKQKNKSKDIKRLPPQQLDALLQQLYWEVRKNVKYERASLTAMEAAVDRYSR